MCSLQCSSLYSEFWDLSGPRPSLSPEMDSSVHHCIKFGSLYSELWVRSVSRPGVTLQEPYLLRGSPGDLSRQGSQQSLREQELELLRGKTQQSCVLNI